MGDQRFRGVESHGKGFRGVYSVQGVRYRTGTYPTRKAAAAARGTALEDARKGVHLDPRRVNLTLDGFYTLWAPRRTVRASSAYQDGLLWKNHIKPRLGHMPLAAISALDVQSWLKWMQDTGRSTSTQRKAFILLQTALGRKGAVADRRLVSNPCDIVDAPKHHREPWEYLTKEDFAKLLAALPDDQKIMALLGAYCGLRWSEIAGLQRQDYNPLKQTLTVQRGLVRVNGIGNVINTPKNGKPRTIPLHPTVTAALNIHVAKLGDEPFLLTTVTGKPLNAANWHKYVWKPALLKAGLVGLRFHGLRHLCASWLLASGADLAQVKEIMGHSSVLTTMLYIETQEDAKRAAVLRAFP